jgi:hypothetical protein
MYQKKFAAIKPAVTCFSSKAATLKTVLNFPDSTDVRPPDTRALKATVLLASELHDTIRYDTIRYDTIRYDTIRYIPRALMSSCHFSLLLALGCLGNGDVKARHISQCIV